MTKKKINIGLILVVLGLWGAVGYRFIKNNYPQHDITDVNHSSNKISQKLIVERDTFLLEPLARDPFLDRKKIEDNTYKNVIRKSHYNKLSTKRASILTYTIKRIYWPEIQYCGFIQSSSKNEKVILVKIDGELVKMHRNEIKYNLIVKDVCKDSISIILGKQKKVFKHYRNQIIN